MCQAQKPGAFFFLFFLRNGRQISEFQLLASLTQESHYFYCSHLAHSG